MKSKKILLISYYFPPLGGAGISRPLSMFRHLSQFGYSCHVLTVKPVLYRVYEPELLEGLDQSRIFRSGSRDPSRLLYILGIRKISSGNADKSQQLTKHFFPDAKAGWINPAVRLAKTLNTKNRYDLVMSTSPSMSAHVVGMKISQEFDIPWAADFQDYWTLEKAEKHFDSKDYHTRAASLLSQIRNNAATVIANNESVAKYVGAETVIPNSFESELARLWKPPTSTEKFVFGVFGTLGENNPIEPLLKVLSRLKENSPALYARTKVLQVGQVKDEWLKVQLQQHGHAEIFDLKGYQGRAHAISMLSEAAIFYFGVSREIGQGITPIRLYTLLASGRPILASAPSGSEVDKLLTSTDNSLCFNNDNVDNGVDFVKAEAENFFGGKLDYSSVPDYAKEYSSEKMVEKFAGLFDNLL